MFAFFFRSTFLEKFGSSFTMLASIHLFQIHSMIFVSELGKSNHTISSRMMDYVYSIQYSIQWLCYEILSHRQQKEKWENVQAKCPWLEHSKGYSLDFFN